MTCGGLVRIPHSLGHCPELGSSRAHAAYLSGAAGTSLPINQSNPPHFLNTPPHLAIPVDQISSSRPVLRPLDWRFDASCILNRPPLSQTRRHREPIMLLELLRGSGSDIITSVGISDYHPPILRALPLA